MSPSLELIAVQALSAWEGNSLSLTNMKTRAFLLCNTPLTFWAVVCIWGVGQSLEEGLVSVATQRYPRGSG